MLGRNFWLLLFNRAFTRIAYHITTFALIVWIFRLTGVNVAVSLWMVVFLVASFCTSLISGVAIDLYDRRLVMIFSNLAWATAVLAFLLVPESFPGILLVSFVTQALDEFFSPAQGAALPQIVRSSSLVSANALMSLATYTASFLGYFFSGIMLRFLGYPAPFVTAAVLVLIGALFASFLPELHPNGDRLPLTHLFRRLKGELLDQFYFLKQNRQVLGTMLITSLVLSGSGAAGSIAPGFSEQALGIDSRDLSFVAVLPIGLGLLLGIAILGRWGRLIPVWKGLLGFGAIFMTLAVSPALRIFLVNHLDAPRSFEQLPLFSLWIAGLMFLLGLFASGISIPIVSSLQRITPVKNMGRTFAALGTVAAVLTTLFVLVFGPMADLLSPVFPIGLVGVLAIGLSFWVRTKIVVK